MSKIGITQVVLFALFALVALLAAGCIEDKSACTVEPGHANCIAADGTVNYAPLPDAPKPAQPTTDSSISGDAHDGCLTVLGSTVGCWSTTEGAQDQAFKTLGDAIKQTPNTTNAVISDCGSKGYKTGSMTQCNP